MSIAPACNIRHGGGEVPARALRCWPKNPRNPVPGVCVYVHHRQEMCHAIWAVPVDGGCDLVLLGRHTHLCIMHFYVVGASHFFLWLWNRVWELFRLNSDDFVWGYWSVLILFFVWSWSFWWFRVFDLESLKIEYRLSNWRKKLINLWKPILIWKPIIN